MDVNRLKMNSDKIELILCGTRSKIKLYIPGPISINDESLPLSDKVKNLGVYIDSTLNMESHIKHLARNLNIELRRLRHIRPYVNMDAAKTLASAFMLSKFDYCNALMAALPAEKINSLQRIQNNAARMITKRPKRSHVTPILKQLHWLPVKARIDYKILTLCYRCITENDYPSYMKDLIAIYTPTRSLRSSSDSTLLAQPRAKLKTSGERSFSFIAPKIWNKLPRNIRESPTLSTFKKNLKTYLFRGAYKY